jgi:2-methylcitrate synthase
MSSGLQNVVAGESSISTVGTGTGLNYRGFNVNELSQKSNFEEVAFMLLFNHFPNSLELSWMKNLLHKSRNLSSEMKKILGKII